MKTKNTMRAAGVKAGDFNPRRVSLVAPGQAENTDQTEQASRSANSQPDFKPAARVQTSLLAPFERASLMWLARHAPSWLKPDHLTLLGFAAMLFAGSFYALARWWPPSLLIVNFWIAVNWFGDSLDGTLARSRNKQRPRYGFYVDHIVDAFGSLFVLSGLALSGYMTPIMAMAVLVAYSLLSINVYLATYTIGTFRLSFYKFGPTELRVLLIIGNTVALTRPSVRVFGERLLLFDVSAIVTISLMSVILLISVIRNTVTLYRAERV